MDDLPWWLYVFAGLWLIGALVAPFIHDGLNRRG